MNLSLLNDDCVMEDLDASNIKNVLHCIIFFTRKKEW